MDILQYINRMNRLYGNDPTPVRYNTQQYLQGGRVGMKPGGLVEPGVTHYATRGGVRGDPSDPARQFTQKKNKWDRIKTVIDEVDKTGDINILKSQTRKTGGKLTMNQANILSNASTDPDVFNEAVKFLDMDRKELRSLLNKREANIADVKVKAGTKRALTLPDIQLQNQMHKIVMKGASSVDDLAKELKISKAKALDIADKLYTNIYATRVEMGKGKYSTKKITPWLPKEDVAIDKLLKNLGNTKGLRATQQENIGKLFYNAFGRETLPNGKKNLSYNPKKYKQTLSKLAEYNRIVELLPEGIKLNLDHPLSKMALKNMNASADQLVRVTPISESLNKGLKLRFDTAYANALKSKDLTKQKAVQKLANQLGINIGKVTKGGALQYGVKDFRKLDMAQTVIDNLKQQNVIAENIKNLDPNLKRAAGMERYKFNINKVPKNELKGIAKILSDNGFKCKLQGGLTCNDPRAYMKALEEAKVGAAKGDEVALSKFRKVANGMRKLKGAAAFTGWGILGEIGFALPFAAMDYADGQSTARIINNASFGLFGMNEEEETISYLPEGSKGAEQIALEKSYMRHSALTDPDKSFPKGRIGMDPKRFQTAQQDVIKGAHLDLVKKVTPFMQGPRNEYFNQEAFAKAYGEVEAAKAKQAADIAKRKEERTVDTVFDYYDNYLPGIDDDK